MLGLQDLIKWCTTTGNYRLCVNTNDLSPMDIFVAFKGKKLDGHDFIDLAIQKNASSIIANKPVYGLSKPLFVVDDQAKAMLKIASIKRDRFCGKVVGITGSAGKTTIKEMINAVISDQSTSCCSIGNFNNMLGLPISIGKMSDEVEYWVLEMGMSYRGEIENLSKVSRPDFVAISNIDYAHIENLGSLEAIAYAKSEIFKGLNEKGVVVLNHDDDFYPFLKEEALKFTNNIFSFGEHRDAHVRLLSLNNAESQIDVDGKIFYFKTAPLYFIKNVMLTLAMIYRMGFDVNKALDSLSKFKNIKGRDSVIIKNISLIGTIKIIDSSYNANPASMRAALDLLERTPSAGRKVVIIGDMLELGINSIECHKGISDYFCGASVLITVGDLMKQAHVTLRSKVNKILHYDEVESLKRDLISILKDGDLVLFKASNKVRLFELVEFLLNLEG